MKIITESWINQAPLSRLEKIHRKIGRKSLNLSRMCYQLKEYNILSPEIIEEHVRCEINQSLLGSEIHARKQGRKHSYGPFDNYDAWRFRITVVRADVDSDWRYATENNRIEFTEVMARIREKLIDEIGFEWNGVSNNETGMYSLKSARVKPSIWKKFIQSFIN